MKIESGKLKMKVANASLIYSSLLRNLEIRLPSYWLVGVFGCTELRFTELHGKFVQRYKLEATNRQAQVLFTYFPFTHSLKKQYLCTLYRFRFFIQKDRMKRELGESPKQSRCCKLLFNGQLIIDS